MVTSLTKSIISHIVVLALLHFQFFSLSNRSIPSFQQWGFRCFLTELSSFVLSFLLSVYQNLWQQAKDYPCKDGSVIPAWKRPGTYIMFGCIVLVTAGAIEIKNVLNLATKYIFIDSFRDKFA